MKALQTFRNGNRQKEKDNPALRDIKQAFSNNAPEFHSAKETGQTEAGKTPRTNPNLYVQLLGIPLIAIALTGIANQAKTDVRPLILGDVSDIGIWMHQFLFLGAVLMIYSFDLIMDVIDWDGKGVKLEKLLVVVGIAIFITGALLASWVWFLMILGVNGFFVSAVSDYFGPLKFIQWMLGDWGGVLVLMVAAYGFMAYKKLPFLAMVSPFVIAFSISLLMLMPSKTGFWWMGGDALNDVQILRSNGIFLYYIGCFMLNVLLVQRMEKEKDWVSNSPNVWLLFAVDFSSKKLKYREDEPVLADFPRFWWVPYFWFFITVILIVFGLSLMIQGDDLLESRAQSYEELKSLNLFFERYAFRAMLFGFYYGLLRLLQTFIQWNRIYRLLVELGLLILIL